MCNAIETLDGFGNFKTTHDLINQYEVVARVVKKDVIAIVRSREWYIHDFDDKYDEACDMTYKTLYKTYLSSVKRFYMNQNLNEALRWLINRITSNLRNISFDLRYRKDLQVSLFELYEAWKPLYVHQETADILDELYRFDRTTLLQGLRKVWEEALEDLEFDEIDFRELCEKFGFTIEEVMGETILLKSEQTADGNRQLILIV